MSEGEKERREAAIKKKKKTAVVIVLPTFIDELKIHLSFRTPDRMSSKLSQIRLKALRIDPRTQEAEAGGL